MANKNKRFQYFVLDRYIGSFLDMPDGVVVSYNFAVKSFDHKIGKELYGYVEFNRQLTYEEQEKFRLVPAEVDDNWI